MPKRGFRGPQLICARGKQKHIFIDFEVSDSIVSTVFRALCSSSANALLKIGKLFPGSGGLFWRTCQNDKIISAIWVFIYLILLTKNMC